MTDNVIDARGTACPMPLIRLAKAVKGLDEGELVEIVGDDPIFELGVREFCSARGYTVEKSAAMGREVRMTLRVGAGERAADR